MINRIILEDILNEWIEKAKNDEPKISLEILSDTFEDAKLKVWQSIHDRTKK